MGFFARLFRGNHQVAAKHALRASTTTSGMQKPTLMDKRRELLRGVLREALDRHGIPRTWITADTLTATSRDRAPGIHWRLSVRHWHPDLMNHAVAFQNALRSRVLALDATAAVWLMGVSWQFTLADESACPPMPTAESWTQPVLPNTPANPAGVVTHAAAPQAPVAAPVTARKSSDDLKADMERLMAIRDADFVAAGAADATEPGAAHTQPMFLRTEPAKL
jgi:hypothetical protein